MQANDLIHSMNISPKVYFFPKYIVLLRKPNSTLKTSTKLYPKRIHNENKHIANYFGSNAIAINLNKEDL